MSVTGWVLQGNGGRGMKASSAHWSRQTPTGLEFAYCEVEFSGVVNCISSHPRGDETMEIRAHGPGYAVCKILRPPT